MGRSQSVAPSPGAYVGPSSTGTGTPITMAMDPADAQKLMSPRLWIRGRLPEEKAVPTFIEVTAAASQKARETVPHRQDIRYGPGPKQLIDEYGCDLPKDAPIVVFIHGGYWHVLNKNDSAFMVQPLYAVGCRVFVIGYDLCPSVTVSDIVGQVNEGTKFILRYAAENGSKSLWFLGHSAGGHLVVTLALNGVLTEAINGDKPPTIGVMPFGGIFDLTPLIHTDINKSLHLTKEQAERLSPVLHPAPPPSIKDKLAKISFIIVTCEHDTPELQRQSRVMCEKLKSFGAPAEVLCVEKMDHFNFVEDLSKEDYLVTTQLKSLVHQQNNIEDN